MKSASQIMRDLVAVQSDTGTSMEIAVADKILETIREDAYFKAHPDLCGAYQGGDALGRPVVWALKKGSGSRTLIISGHYDCVEIESYGSLKKHALDPDRLKELMLAEPGEDPQLNMDLQSADWVFGRGTADMKGGLAAGLYAFLNYAGGDINVLFTAVSDEENLSAGARQAVSLYAELKERYGLDYILCVICEPSGRNPDEDEPFRLVGGCPGKILPVVLAKGRLAHSCYVLNGLNSALILAEIIRNVELSTDFLSIDCGVSTQPPAAQVARDLKDHYDVSLPEYSAAAFNMTFLCRTDPMDFFEKLKGVCRESLDAVLARYNSVFEEMENRGFVSADVRSNLKPTVMTVQELKNLVLNGKDGYGEFEENLSKRASLELAQGKTMQEVSIAYIKQLVEFSGITSPAVVIGIAPPYYPAVSNHYLDTDIRPFLSRVEENLMTRHGLRVAGLPYSQGMTDMSYMSCVNPESVRQVMDNMGLPFGLYSIDDVKLAELNTPTLLIGPAGRGIHQSGERVYLPDVEKHIPTILEEIMRSM
jgi:arginine utilization protein RocB